MEDINLIFKNQKEFFESGKTINVDYRIKNLKKLNDIIKKNEDITKIIINTLIAICAILVFITFLHLPQLFYI